MTITKRFGAVGSGFPVPPKLRPVRRSPQGEGGSSAGGSRNEKRAVDAGEVEDSTAPTEILDALTTTVTTFDELCEHYLPTLAARIWQTCCWPEKMAGGWAIGDFRFIIVSVSPESPVCLGVSCDDSPNLLVGSRLTRASRGVRLQPDRIRGPAATRSDVGSAHRRTDRTQLYIQFWSEPHEVVANEVCSGEWSPGSLKYVQRPQRELLRSLGFAKGGEARNFQKEVTITRAAQAEAAARETLWIFYEAFGYRGQWPLELQLERHTRARQDAVHDSLTPEDFVRLLNAHGYHAELADSEGGPLILARRGKRHFTARLDWKVPKNNLYAAMMLDALFPAAAFVSDEGLVALTLQLPGVAVQRFEADSLRLSMAVRLDGGVTDVWIVHSVAYFLDAIRQCERLLRAAAASAQRARPRETPESVH
jgi:hypothetical protein